MSYNQRANIRDALRCTLTVFERKYQVIIPSNLIIQRRLYFKIFDPAYPPREVCDRTMLIDPQNSYNSNYGTSTITGPILDMLEKKIKYELPDSALIEP